MICITNLILSLIWTGSSPVFVSRLDYPDLMNINLDYSAYLESWYADVQKHPYYWKKTDPEHQHNSIPAQYALIMDEQLLPEAERRKAQRAAHITTATLPDRHYALNPHMVSSYQGRADMLPPWQSRCIFHDNRRSHHRRFLSRPREKKQMVIRGEA